MTGWRWKFFVSGFPESSEYPTHRGDIRKNAVIDPTDLVW